MLYVDYVDNIIFHLILIMYYQCTLLCMYTQIPTPLPLYSTFKRLYKTLEDLDVNWEVK